MYLMKISIQIVKTVIHLQITAVLADAGMMVKYLRKSGDHYSYPQVEDVAWCQGDDCKKVSVKIDNRMHCHIRK